MLPKLIINFLMSRVSVLQKGMLYTIHVAVINDCYMYGTGTGTVWDCMGLHFSGTVMLTWVLLLLLDLHFSYTCGLDDQKYKRVITVNVNGSSSIDCCKYHLNCDCSSLESALNYVRDNTLINIISSIVPLSSLIKISGHTTIGISGNNGTVISCNNTGGVSFVNCKNIDISGITWDQCGGTGFTGAVFMEQSSNIVINKCTFQKSTAFGIVILGASGVVTIQQTNFLYNYGNASGGRGGGGLLVKQMQKNGIVEHFSWKFTVSKCTFIRNGFIHGLFNRNYVSGYCGGGVCIWLSDPSIVSEISIENCTFIDNWDIIGGSIYIYALVNSIVLHFNNLSYFYETGGSRSFCVQLPNAPSSACFEEHNNFIVNLNATVVSLSIDKSEFTFASFKIESFSKYAAVHFNDSSLTGTTITFHVYKNHDYCVVKFNRLVGNNTSLQIDGSKSHGIQAYIINCLFVDNNNGNPVVSISNARYHLHALTGIHIYDSTFFQNSNGNSVVQIKYNIFDHKSGTAGLIGRVHISATIFKNNLNNDHTLYLHYCMLTITGAVIFSNNAGTKGGGIYFTQSSYAVLSDNARVEFINNIALIVGGAIYADCPFQGTWLLFRVDGNYSATFIDNTANSIGNSIFFNISSKAGRHINRNSSSSNSIVHIPRQFNYSNNDNQIATSPYSVSLGPTATCISESCDQNGTYSISNVMLGEKILNSAEVIGYFNNTSEAALFHVECIHCTDYKLSSISSSFVYIGMSQGFSITGKEVKSDIVLTVQLSSISGVISKMPIVNIAIKLHLSPCHIGYEYDIDSKICICSDFNGIVSCSNPVKIRRGYWYGTVNGERAVTLCPNNYCDFSSCPINSKFCNVSSFRCSSDRSGIGCGDCDENFSLPFDSDKCAFTNKCQIDRIIVIVVTILYWIMTIFVVRLLMYFITVEAITGYVYGIIFFYSVLEFIIEEDLIVSDALMLFVTILSSIVNISPKFLGKLCFTEGLSEIDQEVIHYIHPLAIVLLLLIIARAANRSVRVTAFLGQRGVVRSICLLLLLFYTSLSSTSWQLLRPLTFNGANGVYTYLSPDIKYFSGRHIVYGLIAILCGIVIVLGLPFLLLFEPLLRRWFSFFKVKPLLDQFQGCYKSKYHCFAAFYLICRLLILSVISLEMLELNYRYLILQMLCLVIAMVHAWVQPYKNSGLNSLDLSILLIMLMIMSLNIGTTYSILLGSVAANELIVAALILLPLIMFITFLLYSNNFCKYFIMRRANHRYLNLQR